jgi:hypothetical protein
MVRRLLAGLLVLGILAGLSLPVLAQEKDKGKDAKDKEKEKDKGPAGDKSPLKWKFTKDQVFYQKMFTRTNQMMNVMKNDVPQTQEQTFFFSWKVDKIDGDKVTLKQKIEGVKMKIDIVGNTISYDSTAADPANNPLADYFKALVGTEFIVELDTKDLRVTKLEGRDEFLKKLIAANPQMKTLLDTILSENALKEMAEPTFAVVPNAEVAKGHKWKREAKLNMGPIGSYENTYNYEYTGLAKDSKDKHVIKVDTTLNYTPPAESVGQGGLPFKIKKASLKSSSQGGEIVFDSTKGLLERSAIKIELKGDLTIEIGGTETKVTLSQVQESIVEAIDKLPTIPKKGG